MAGRKGITRKSLKEPDEFVTLSARLLEQVLLHKMKLLFALGALVVIVMAVSAIGYFSRQGENKSLAALGAALAHYDAVRQKSDGAAAYPAVKDDFEALMATYGGKSGGMFARFVLADICFEAGDYERAAELYGRSADDFGENTPVGLLARSSLGYVKEQSGETDAAVRIFTELAEEKTLVADEALFALARLHAAAGHPEQEAQAYGELMTAYPESMFVTVAREKIPARDL